MAAMTANQNKEAPRQLECILTFTSEDSGILEYLNGSHHKKYAKRWQRKHTKLSPCDFRDNFGWIGYVREKLKLEKLHLDVEEVEMVLYDEAGFDPIGEPSIHNDDYSWEIEQFEEAFEEACARKAVFTFTLIRGRPPYTIPSKTPEGLTHLVPLNEEQGTTVGRVVRASTELQSTGVAVAPPAASDARAQLVPEALNDGGSQATATPWERFAAILKQPAGDMDKARESVRAYELAGRKPKNQTQCSDSDSSSDSE
jgi:hypothetical protein